MPGGKKDLSPAQQVMSDAKHVVEHTVAEKAVHGAAHALTKAAPLAAKAIGGTVAKLLPAVAGGIPGAVTAAFSGDAGRGFHEKSKNKNDMTSSDVQMKRSAMYRKPMANLMTKKMITVKTPTYPGQSTMGKALMASAKKKV
jgi:hypothetical protein